MKTLALIPLLALLAGCATGNLIGPSLVQTGVAAGVSYGVLKYPKTVPELRIAGEVICAAANSTNISPASVIASIKAAGPISPETSILVNGAMALYIGIWNGYGQDAVNNIPQLKLYLRATCDGVNIGLGPAMPAVRTEIDRWPLLRSE